MTAAARAPADPATLLWLAVPLLLVLLPYTTHLSAWISLSWLGFALLGLNGARRRRRPLGRVTLTLATLAGVASVIIDYGGVIGPGGGLALLAFLSGVKLLQTETPRDRIGTLFVGCFLLVGHFLETQSLPHAVYMILAALALTAGFIAIQTDDCAAPDRIKAHCILAGRLLLQALPLALLLFLLFPRLQGPLWNLPQQGTARTGLSDSMSPGDISRLLESDELAFRAEFAGAQPDSSQLYWRGPVFWEYDGRAWRSIGLPPPAPVRAETFGQPVRYSLTMEAHRQQWLFLFGLPEPLPPSLPDRRTFMTPDLQWLTREPVGQRLRYELTAYPDYRLDPVLDEVSRRRALDLPEAINPRARALAARWRAGAGSDAAIVEEALRLFRQERFFYTLRPPALGTAQVDDFLFETRRGFCEHYAGSFVFLMRAAGVPARVVTGYQGGEYNQLGNYWIVRGRDAHAWTEVWLDGRGWTRVDPTAAVAPSRVERGVEAALPAGERPGGVIALDGAWLRPLRLGWDVLNNQWNQWVLGYNQERQRRLLARLAPWLADWRGMVSTLGIGAAVVVLTLALVLFGRRPPTASDPASRAYARFCRKLARIGIVRAPAEAPEEYARRAAGARPDLAGAIAGITRRYLALRYGPPRPGAPALLKRAVRDFRPSRHPPASIRR